jgi:hypothetical protein
MRKLLFAAVAGASLMVALAAGSIALADGNGSSRISAKLNGYNEVTSVSTVARGEFRARINKQANTIDYTLSYSGIEGGTANQAHIHFAQKHTNGGISAWLCGGGGEAACPPTAGTVTGTITAAEVVGPADRGIEPPTAMEELIRAIRAGATYANVHSTRWGGGEIRGQIKGRGDDD